MKTIFTTMFFTLFLSQLYANVGAARNLTHEVCNMEDSKFICD